ncbi:MAG: glycosyltransferase family 4 protein [Chloroflexaceae bacterium]|nr:glycosyltransferase family 4 protein [Chloroflexaceae bacterium]
MPTAEHPGSMAPLARQVQSLRNAGVSMDVLEITGAPKWKYLQTLPRQWKYIALGKPDLVHAHFGYCGMLARCQLQKPLVVSFMGDDLLGEPDDDGRITLYSKVIVQIDRLLARFVDAVIVKSEEMARIVAPVKAHVIPNGVDTERFYPIEPAVARQRLGWSAGKRYILFTGNPAFPRKGFPLAQAITRYVQHHFDEPVELVILWDVLPDHVPLYMNASDVMILPSLFEGSPNVVKEALACNVPVVSGPVGDVSFLLDGVEGCEVCPREEAAMGAAVVRVLQTGQRVAGRAALERKGLDLATVAQRILAVYTDVLQRSC